MDTDHRGNETPRPQVTLDRRTILRGAALATGGALLGGAMSLGERNDAVASAQPRVYTRSNWGARSPKGPVTVLSKGPTHIVVHHTATANTSDYSTSRAAALSRSIQRHHMDTNGWSDLGQQLTISRGGHIMEGRHRSLRAIREGGHVVGAHTANHNAHTIGIENEGTYTSVRPPAQLMDSLIDTCVWLCLVYRLDPVEAIVGHRDYNATACPGDQLYAMLPQLRRDVQGRMRRRLSHQRAETGHGAAPQELPNYPEVPLAELAAEFYHGPVIGEGDVVV